jgi:transcriptional regulator of met regulon
MMVSPNIPLHKAEAASYRMFLEKYTTQPIPTESTLRKNYLASCYEDTINKIRNSVGKKQNMGLHR